MNPATPNFLPSTYPSIDVRDLRKRGLLKGPAAGGVTEACTLAIGVDPTIQVRVTVNYEWMEVQVSALINGVRFSSKVEIERTCEREGTAIYFLCGVSRKRIRTLYFYEGRFVSRHELGLRYPSQAHVPKPPARTTRRKASASASASIIPKRRNGLRFDTLGAIDRAVSTPEGWAEWMGGLNRAAAELQFSPAASLPFIGQWERRLILEDQPIIDIRVIVREGYLYRGRLTGFVLAWPRPSPVRRLYGLTDLRAEQSFPFVGLRWKKAGRQHHQAVRLIVPSDGERFLMKCPVTGQPVDTVAFRWDRFASRIAQRLVNRSQRAV